MTAQLTPEGHELLETIRRQRGGKSMPMHEVLAARDPAFLNGYNDLFNAAQSDAQGLSADVRELIVMALDIVAGGSPKVARAHARKAVRLGATEAQVLGAIELATLVMAGRAMSYLPTIFDHEAATS
ncbi:carboxymuconolactone decarboxylase family protein [Solwaraspora sp. WMMB335]|uniref:carboxymuconolactone decarboxylase family protein n=1 Tax=Solwaraspora sp. WMMB335 TaxID=3404118 RepID=UPI003B961BFA